MAKKKSKSKLKSSKVKIKIPTPEPVDEAVVSQVSAFGGVKSPSPLPPPVLPISSHHVVSSTSYNHYVSIKYACQFESISSCP